MHSRKESSHHHCTIVDQELWMSRLQKHTTHTFTLQNEPGAFLSSEKSLGILPWKVAAHVADFRWERGRGRKIINQKMPKLGKLNEKIQKLPERKTLPIFTGTFEPILPQQPLDTKRFIELATTMDLGLNKKTIEHVVRSLTFSWSTHYRGFSEWYLNFNIPDKENEAQMRKEIQEDIKIGRIAGPLTRPPFPTTWCNKQAKVCRTFGIPKNKLDWLDPTLLHLRTT